MTKKEKSWILYDVANSAYTMTVMSTIFPIFFKSYIASGIPEYQSTFYMGLGNGIYTAVIALLAPILGTIADYKDLKKRFFIIFFITGVVATTGFIFMVQGKWMLALFIYIISAIGFGGSEIFYDSMLVDVTDEDRMHWVSTSGFAWGYIGSCIPFALCMVVITQYKLFGFSSSTPSVRLSFLITAIWWFLFALPLIKNVKQVHYIEREPQAIKKSFQRITETLKKISSYKTVFLFLVAYFFYIDGVNTIIKMATSYGTDIGISANTLILILLITQIVAFPCALIFGKLSKKISPKKLLLFGICVYLVITILGFFLPDLPTNTLKVQMFWAMAMLVATSQGGIQALSRSIFARIIPKEHSGEFFGFYNIFGKFATILGPILMGGIGAIFGHSRYGVLSLIVLFLVGGIMLIKVDLKD